MDKITLDNYEAFLLDHMEGNLDAESTVALKAFVINHPELEIDLQEMDLPSIADEVIAFDFKDSLKKSNSDFTAETIVDYLENNLPINESELFESKLLINKDLQFELGAYKKTISIADQSITFANKTELYKAEDDLLLKDRVLAYFEGQLNLEARVVFEKELKSSSALQSELSAYAKTKLKADVSVIYPHKEDLKKEAKVIVLFSFRNVASMAAAILLLFGFFVVFNYYNKEGVSTDTKLANKTLPQNSKEQIVKTDTIKQLPSVDAEHGVKDVQLAAIDAKTKNTRSNNDSSNSAFEKNMAVQQEENKPAVLKEEIQKVEEKIHEQNLVAIEQKLEKQNPEVPDNLVASSETQEKYTVLAYADDAEMSGTEKKGFWNKAVRLAKQANKLGVKSVDGNETDRRKFSLSFNSFSVEKH